MRISKREYNERMRKLFARLKAYKDRFERDKDYLGFEELADISKESFLLLIQYKQ